MSSQLNPLLAIAQTWSNLLISISLSWQLCLHISSPNSLPPAWVGESNIQTALHRAIGSAAANFSEDDTDDFAGPMLANNNSNTKGVNELAEGKLLAISDTSQRPVHTKGRLHS